MRRLAIVIPTHNRAGLLRKTLRSLVPQLADAPACALLVVDNNSTDETPAVAAEFPQATYLQERRQGLSHARNAGISAFEPHDSDIVAFIDDDIEAAPGWIAALLRAFDSHPEADCVGGPVRPARPDALPSWITREHWAPLALQDHGSEPRRFDLASPIGLVGANFAFRGDVFHRIGLFSPDVQRVNEGIGSTEDHEFLGRLYASGGRALYIPDAVVTTEVPAERMTRDYHRRWHRGHGRFHALMRTPDMERARGRVFGVPLHLVRSAVRDAAAWLRLRLSGHAARAFSAETRLRFFSGFVRERSGWLTRR